RGVLLARSAFLRRVRADLRGTREDPSVSRGAADPMPRPAVPAKALGEWSGLWPSARGAGARGVVAYLRLAGDAGGGEYGHGPSANRLGYGGRQPAAPRTFASVRLLQRPRHGFADGGPERPLGARDAGPRGRCRIRVTPQVHSPHGRI